MVVLELCSEEYKPIIEALIEKYNFLKDNGFNADGFVYVKSIGKKKGKAISLSKIRSPYNLLVNQRFILTINADKFADLDESRKNLHFLNALLKIENFQNGKMRKFSIQGFPEILGKYGLDWEEKENLPNILEEDKEKKE